MQHIDEGILKNPILNKATVTKAIVTKVTALLITLSFTSFSVAMEISGILRLDGKEAKTAKIADAIVYFIPDDRSAVQIETGEYRLTMEKKQFVPRTQAVPTGSTVLIPNNDTISHNAFSLSEPNDFDSDLYGKGEQYNFKVKAPSIVKIYCNVHYHMVAYVLALDTPYYTQPDAGGKFILEVPDLPGKIVVWHERTNDYVQTVDPQYANLINAGLRITKRRLPAHNNKFGRGYRRVR